MQKVNRRKFGIHWLQSIGRNKILVSNINIHAVGPLDKCRKLKINSIISHTKMYVVGTQKNISMKRFF